MPQLVHFHWSFVHVKLSILSVRFLVMLSPLPLLGYLSLIPLLILLAVRIEFRVEARYSTQPSLEQDWMNVYLWITLLLGTTAIINFHFPSRDLM